MEVVTLRCTKKNTYNQEHTEFHFKDNESADKFLYVFKDHWCHVSFDKIKEDKPISKSLEEELAKDPKKRAEDNLSWGFNLAKDYGDDKTTAYESSVIERIINMTSGGQR